MSPAIWVGSYGKYNKGILAGKWLKLEDYDNRDEFYEAAEELHNDEADPEFMFNDWEYLPESLVGESWVSEDVWPMIKHDSPFEAKVAFVEWFGKWDEDAFEDSFAGAWESDIDFAWEFAESVGDFNSIPDHLRAYFDIEKYARDLMFDYHEDNGFYFRAV